MVFADEPTGALNSASSDAVLDILTDFNRDGQSIVMVTHDMKSARRGNRIIYLKDGAICGECHLGPYVTGDKERHAKLRAFLGEMGW
jgi:putative ABC transport system ATP-binding protein